MGAFCGSADVSAAEKPRSALSTCCRGQRSHVGVGEAMLVARSGCQRPRRSNRGSSLTTPLGASNGRVRETRMAMERFDPEGGITRLTGSLTRMPTARSQMAGWYATHATTPRAVILPICFLGHQPTIRGTWSPRVDHSEARAHTMQNSPSRTSLRYAHCWQVASHSKQSAPHLVSFKPSFPGSIFEQPGAMCKPRGGLAFPRKAASL